MMPTSATGNKSAQQGFSLAEVLIVMFMIALAARVVVLALPNPERDLRQDVEAFAARLAAAQDMAILHNRAIATVVDVNGYRFEEQRRGEWVPATAETLSPKRWSDGVQVLIGAAGTTRVTVDGVGLATSSDIVFFRNGARMTVSITQEGEVRIDA